MLDNRTAPQSNRSTSQPDHTPQLNHTSQPNPAPQPYSIPHLQHQRRQKQPSAYIILDPSYQKDGSPQQYHANDIITFAIQKYQLDPIAHRFDSVMSEPVWASLQVNHYFDRQDDNYDLPYQLDGIFVDFSEIPLAQRTDPVFSALDSSFRFTFRFDPLQGVGCLVHFGTDIAAYERSPLCLLWRTALWRDHTATPGNIIQLASNRVPKIYPVIPSDR